MSQNTTPDETPLSPAEPRVDTHRPREGWIERFKVALGLKAPASIREDLAHSLEETEDNETEDFTREERRILRNLLMARDIRVADVMVARGAILGVSEDSSIAELKARFASAEHSRLPVYGETLDDPKGMIHIRDLFARLDQLAPEATLASLDLTRPVLFAPGTMLALDLLLEMQSKHIHMALVIDEYGATDGLVSIEDLLEIIVGDIEDEHDIAEDSAIETFPDGAIAIGARAELEEVAKLMGTEFAPPSEDHDIGTIGGYVTAFLGRVPAPGEILFAPNGLIITVIEGDARRLKRVRISPTPPTTDEA